MTTVPLATQHVRLVMEEQPSIALLVPKDLSLSPIQGFAPALLDISSEWVANLFVPIQLSMMILLIPAWNVEKIVSCVNLFKNAPSAQPGIYSMDLVGLSALRTISLKMSNVLHAVRDV